MKLELTRSWRGEPLMQAHGSWSLAATPGGLAVEGRAQRVGGPPVAAPPGRVWRLWEHEVLELFLLGEGSRYVELEFGPGGHWLALALAGEREVVDAELSLSPRFGGSDTHWTVACTVPWAMLPAGLARVNGFAIVGPKKARRHFAWRGGAARGGDAPDFHVLEAFGPLDEALRSACEAARA